MYNKDCIFCQIAQKKTKTKLVYEDPEIVAFPNIAPKARIHLLIIPKNHFESLNRLEKKDVSLLGKMMLVAQKLATQEKIAQTGFRLVLNNGPDSGQVIPHLHLHLLGGGPIGSMKQTY